MITENLSTLKIHKLTKEQYQRELDAGRIDENALYLTPDEEVDLSGYATIDQLNEKADATHTHGIEEVENLQSKLDETLSTSKTYTDGLVSGKADSNHNHDDVYYTETEIDSKLSVVNTSIGNITSGSTPVKEAEHATSSDSATSSLDAEKLGGQLPSYYAKVSDIPTGALADKDIVSESDLDSSLAAKVNAASEGNHSHSNKTVLDGITSEKVSAWDSAEVNAKAYADTAASNAATAVKNDLLNGAGTAYDTLKELGDLIDDNKDAIDALEDIASGKANAAHTHAIADVSGLQSALDGKAAASHGTHVTYDSTNKPKMDGTAAFGTSSSVARADHVHPTDTSRASQSDLDALETVVSGKANASHTHAISDVTNLQSSLDAKATTSALNTHANNADIHFTADERTKLAGIATGATKVTVDSALSSTSTNPVQNKVINSALSTATSAITANTNSISSHTSQISALQTAIGEFEEITSADIQALFA